MSIQSWGPLKFSQIGKLDYTCCARNHKRFDSEGNCHYDSHCDKKLLYPVVQQLLTRKLRCLRKSSGRIEIASERYLRATSWYYFSGFDGKEDHRSEASNETSLHAFLEMFKFHTAHDNDDGWTPLRCAALSQNEHIVRQLLDLGVDVNAPFPYDRKNSPFPFKPVVRRKFIFLCVFG